MCEMEGCISYIQLYNKHCQNLVAYNSIHLFSHSFCGLGIRAMWFWFKVSHSATVKMSAGAVVTGRLD